MSYKDTLNMPNTDFPMRGGLNTSEPLKQEAWENDELYQKRLEKNKNNARYVLHDGPPYANGDIHIGHALNKVLKDIVVRDKNMRGLFSRYVPGWDTHGLPIETALKKNKNIDRKKMSVAEFRKACEVYAYEQVAIQKEQFKRLGILGEWDQPYITLQKEYEASQLDVFASMVEKGLIFKGLKPVFWSPSSETALAEAEIEYHEKKSPSVYVKFEAVDHGPFNQPFSYLIWTTTPWTLPANLAVAVEKSFDYILVDLNGEAVLIASGLKETLEKLFETSLKVIQTVKGEVLEHLTYKHPLFNRVSPVVLGHHVMLESGTGLVHIAPGHGEDDFIIGQKYGLDVLCPVNETGHMTHEAYQYEGLFVDECSKQVTSDLEASNHLVKLVFIHHPYPHDWRTNQPIIFRATDQWFASIESLKEDLLYAIQSIEWIPSWGEIRLENMVKDRVSWCISRQRSWGVPIPVFYAEDKTAILDPNIIRHVAKKVKEYGTNIWFEWDAKDLLPEGFTHEGSPNHTFTKETDILDVWFDSGTSHQGGMKDFGLSYPADLYLEGSDQYRGWFNSSLSTGIAHNGVAPYKTILTHGFVLDKDGNKMSKSKGNTVDPNKIMTQKGADILRLWVASVDYQADVRISDEMLAQVSETYRKIRNTMRFVLGALGDFEYSKHANHTHDLINQYMLQRLQSVVNGSLKAYDTFAFSEVVRTVNQFMNRDLSAFYLDMAKDLLYVERKNNPKRRALQTVLYEILDRIYRLLTPILPHTMEEVHQYFNQDEPYVYLKNNEILDYQIDSNITPLFETVLSVRDDVLKALEEARNQKIIGKSLEADIVLSLPQSEKTILESFELLEKLFIVSKVKLEEANKRDVKIKMHAGAKCERCWHHDDLVDGHICKRCHHVLEDLNGK
jgi:isoleucyl-tRNA synthetase